MLKIDEKHPKFRGKVLCSAGIGAGYLKREDAKRHVYIPDKTNESTGYRDWETVINSTYQFITETNYLQKKNVKNYS